MKALVRVLAADADHIRVELAKATSNCGGCAGVCSMLFRRSEHGIRLPATVLEGVVQSNDLLVIEVGSRGLLRTILLACGLPVAGLLAGAGFADAFLSTAWTGPAFGLLGLVGGSLIAASSVARGEALQMRARSARLARR